MTGGYFDARMLNRQRLLWTIATRRQLDRWEPYVAAAGRSSDQQLDGADIWAAEIERHFALVAAGHLLRALELEPASAVAVDATLRSELRGGRDLVEHWVENAPVFNVTPRPRQPTHPSGLAFAERNPDRGPYFPLAWNPKEGPSLLPHVSAPALRELLDAVEAEVLAADPTLASYVPPRERSTWQYADGEWWPRP